LPQPSATVRPFLPGRGRGRLRGTELPTPVPLCVLAFVKRPGVASWVSRRVINGGSHLCAPRDVSPAYPEMVSPAGGRYAVTTRAMARW
jgi:hypothetical protein